MKRLINITVYHSNGEECEYDADEFFHLKWNYKYECSSLEILEISNTDENDSVKIAEYNLAFVIGVDGDYEDTEDSEEEKPQEHGKLKEL